MVLYRFLPICSPVLTFPLLALLAKDHTHTARTDLPPLPAFLQPPPPPRCPRLGPRSRSEADPCLGLVRTQRSAQHDKMPPGFFSTSTLDHPDMAEGLTFEQVLSHPGEPRQKGIIESEFRQSRDQKRSMT